ncbi:MAG: glutamine-hydrolyzing GMP synthase [Chlorobi bacterium]|nr:glutamine-hydrolyzing GMP synthase [Chlorobiota bacterium]
MKHTEWICILDFGSQYTQLIARRVRELGVYSEIHPFNIDPAFILEHKPKGIILSGGPASIYEKDAPDIDETLFHQGIPILGICYGLQVIAKHCGGVVDPAAKREYGPADILINDTEDLFAEIPGTTRVWMSHGDALTKIPEGFEIIGHTDNAPICAIRNVQRKLYGVQFHPEVVHTKDGEKILKNFLFNICDCRGDWTPESFITKAVDDIRKTVGEKQVLCALSGGVDSSVLAVLLYQAIGDQLHCVHIDNGFMRLNESREVVRIFKESYGIPLTLVDGTNEFLAVLRGITHPEEKRKRIGNVFIELFEKEAKALGDIEFLAQGTLYPDVIESITFKGPSATIKTHHNVGGLPEKMNMKLIEPFRELFKDEVRKVGRSLGLPDHLIHRHPFPGPGLAIRILGEVTPERLERLRLADAIFIDELKKSGLYNEVWQAFAVLLPVQSVGVMGDTRTYENTIALRAVTSVDGMTADWAQLPFPFLSKVSSRIINEVRGVNRVVYDISSKPPATIEWE